MKNQKQTKKAYSFKITLNDSKPKIWRRMLVPTDYSFFDLHIAIQDAMGWFDSHLHSFEFTPQNSNQRMILQFPDPENDLFFEKLLDERKEKLRDYFGDVAKQCKYTYDFGDNWDHTVLFEGEKEVSDDQKLPYCKTGENACPFEDSGGIWGYQELLEILKDPKHEQYEDMTEWIKMFDIEDPKDYDPTYFDPQEIKFKNPKERLKEYEEGFGV